MQTLGKKRDATQSIKHKHQHQHKYKYNHLTQEVGEDDATSGDMLGRALDICVCMYLCMVITYSRVWINRAIKVANPARGQRNRENEYFPVPVRA